MPRDRRPRIPDQTQRELWARSAGRCEFRGCNKILYIDPLTQQRANLAVISHIVAYSPEGPRGDPVRSPQLATDIQNLMLTCKEHGHIIDNKALEATYPEALLLDFKQQHEQRIFMLTESKEDAQTHVLLLQASIDRRDFDINQAAAFRAILPKYPAEERARIIDLTGLDLPADRSEAFCVAAESITRRVHSHVLAKLDGRRVQNLSVFALAPIPLLVHFGHLLGDIDCVELYQRHRAGQDWSWLDVEEADQFYDVYRPALARDDGCPVALLLSVSDHVGHDCVKAILGEDVHIYEIRARVPSLNFLRSRARLEQFGCEANDLLRDLRVVHEHKRAIHLFAAVPAPVAIQFGRSIKAFDPPFLVYEYRKADRTYHPALTVNRNGGDQ